MKILSDIEIIESVTNGNQSDFAILVDRYKDKAFSLVNSIVKNDMESEEVLQDCFLKVYSSLRKFRGESKFSTWFYRIVYNTSLTRVSNKKRKIELKMLSIDDLINLKVDGNANSNFNNDNDQLGESLALIVNKLPYNYSAVINLFYLEEMSCHQISIIMNLSFNNVKVLLHRARSALRKIVFENNYVDELL
jgi:RNA polymerase sigma factor (sigma-70 family)